MRDPAKTADDEFVGEANAALVRNAVQATCDKLVKLTTARKHSRPIVNTLVAGDETPIAAVLTEREPTVSA